MLHAVARRPLHLHAEQSRLLLFLMLGREERIGTATDIDYQFTGTPKGSPRPPCCRARGAWRRVPQQGVGTWEEEEGVRFLDSDNTVPGTYTYLYILRVRYFCVLFGTRYLLFHFGSTMYLVLDSYGEYFRIPVHFPSLSLSGEDVGIGSWECAQGRAEDCPEW